jgi:hypothetical protein
MLYEAIADIDKWAPRRKGYNRLEAPSKNFESKKIRPLRFETVQNPWRADNFTIS